MICEALLPSSLPPSSGTKGTEEAGAREDGEKKGKCLQIVPGGNKSNS